MSDIPEQTQGQAVATRPMAQPVTSAGALYDTDKFAHMQRMATALAHGTMLPAAVRGSDHQECFSNLLIVFDMAERLRVTPIALAQSISMVHGKMVLEGKLVNAAITNVLGMTLYPWWVGTRGADDYRIYLSDTPWDEEAIERLQPGSSILGRRLVDGSVGEWKTLAKDRSVMPAWQGVQTQNQLLYRATREFARRYEPAIMLGVYTDDEISAAEERGAARSVTSGVSLSALPTGFANEKTADPVEDAVVEEVAETATETSHGDAAHDNGVDEAKEPDGSETVLTAVEDYTPTSHDDAVKTVIRYGEKGWVPGVDFSINMAGFDEAQQGAILDAYRAAFDKFHGKGQEAKAKPARKPRGKRTKEESTPESTPTEDPAASDEGRPQPDPAGPVDPEPKDDGDNDGYVFNATDPHCPVDAFIKALGDMMDWGTIKQALLDMSAMDAWKQLGPVDQKAVRREVWEQMHRLIDGGHTKFDFLNDLSAFRCWIEWYAEEDGILGCWDILVSMDHFAVLDAESQKRLQSAVNARVAELREGGR